MTSTYTSNPPSNATAFKTWLERTAPGTRPGGTAATSSGGWATASGTRSSRSPATCTQKLAELGATPLAELALRRRGLAGVGARCTRSGTRRVWPVLLELSGARPTEAAAARVAAEKAAAGALTGADSSTAMRRSLLRRPDDRRRRRRCRGRSRHLDRRRWPGRPAVAGAARPDDPHQRRRDAHGRGTRPGCRELQPAESPKRTRHLEISLPPGVAYRAGDHLGVCPKNDEERVERLARHLGAALDGLFMVPKTMNVRAVPKGVVLQVRNVLTNLVDISGRPTVAAARPAAGQGGRPRRAGQAGRDPERPAQHRTVPIRRCARRSTRAATTCSGCWTSSRPAR